MRKVLGVIASPAGRVARVLAGAALITWGLFGLDGAAGVVVPVVGAVPFLAGIFDVCVISAITGGSFKGSDIRAGR